MKKILLSIVILITLVLAGDKNPFIINPFIDFSYDVSGNNSYDYLNDYTSEARNGTNLSFGANIYRKPLYFQVQVANYLNYLRNDGDFFGIIKLGMNDEIYKNGYFDMNFSYTDNLSKYIHYSAYSGSVGYYQLFMPIDTLASGYFSSGINLGFVSHAYGARYWNDLGWYQYYYSANYTEMFIIAEFAWINKYVRPYIAFGLQNMANNDYYPRNSGFFSIGIQAHLNSVFPYLSSNQSKMTYYKHDNYRWIYVFADKPNIYIYPESKIQAKVTLISNKGYDITTSIPQYQNGWNVWVEPSGLIDNKYEYLFYESSKIRYNPTKIGWSLPASDLWQILPQKMIEYGFNEKEIKDFVDYWQIHLTRSEYYDVTPVINRTVDKEFKLIIDPKPTSVLRVWFYINPTNCKNNLKPPSIPKFVRKGYTVVEWGVLLNR